MHTYQAANNIFGQNLGYPGHVHNIHGSFLHYQPDGWGKEKKMTRKNVKNQI